MHDDDVHYNIIVHKSHNTSNDFKDNNVNSKSWAQITKAHRPGYMSSLDSINQDDVEVVKVKENIQVDGGEWQTVGKRGSQRRKYTVPVQNRFDKLSEEEDNEVLPQDDKLYNCEVCQTKISTKTM